MYIIYLLLIQEDILDRNSPDARAQVGFMFLLQDGKYHLLPFSGRDQVYNFIREGFCVQLSQGGIRYTTLLQGGFRYTTLSGRDFVYSFLRKVLGIQLNQGGFRYTT